MSNIEDMYFEAVCTNLEWQKKLQEVENEICTILDDIENMNNTITAIEEKKSKAPQFKKEDYDSDIFNVKYKIKTATVLLEVLELIRDYTKHVKCAEEKEEKNLKNKLKPIDIKEIQKYGDLDFRTICEATFAYRAHKLSEHTEKVTKAHTDFINDPVKNETAFLMAISASRSAYSAYKNSREELKNENCS